VNYGRFVGFKVQLGFLEFCYELTLAKKKIWKQVSAYFLRKYAFFEQNTKFSSGKIKNRRTHFTAQNTRKFIFSLGVWYGKLEWWEGFLLQLNYVEKETVLMPPLFFYTYEQKSNVHLPKNYKNEFSQTAIKLPDLRYKLNFYFFWIPLQKYCF
jgi:hypothetical protein